MNSPKTLVFRKSAKHNLCVGSDLIYAKESIPALVETYETLCCRTPLTATTTTSTTTSISTNPTSTTTPAAKKQCTHATAANTQDPTNMRKRPIIFLDVDGVLLASRSLVRIRLSRTFRAIRSPRMQATNYQLIMLLNSVSDELLINFKITTGV
jgi:hypothetical protein